MSREYCGECDRETPHQVRIDIIEESPKDDPELRSYSREPYRITICTECGTETTQRMNNADLGASV